MAKNRFLRFPFAAALASAAFLTGERRAEAILTYNIYQSGADVVAQASGTLNLGTPNTVANCASNGGLDSSIAVVCTGPGTFLQMFPITGPTTFPGNVNIFSGTGIGPETTGLSGVGNGFGINPSYVSGQPINSRSIFLNQTLASLGFNTTGLIGTWTLAEGGDQINLVLGPPAPAAASAPGPLPLLGAAAAFGFSRRLRRRVPKPCGSA